MRRRHIIAATFITLTLFLLFGVQVWADDSCYHNWVPEYTDYEYGTDTQHYKVDHYYCNKCFDSKEEKTAEAHAWVFDFTDYDYGTDTQHNKIDHYYCSVCAKTKKMETRENHAWVSQNKNYDKYSDSEHSYREDIECSVCRSYSTRSGKEPHTPDKYNNCIYCFEKTGRTVTLKPGKTSYLNEKSWAKIKISKTGYIKLTATNENGSKGWFSIYDKSKRKYLDASDSGNYPVKKGTYYVKPGNDIALKYTFKKDPSKKNYTKGKSIRLKRKKAVMTVIYPSAKKKTWARYYKISVPKKQYLRIYLTTGPSKYSDTLWGDLVTDSQGNSVRMEWARNKDGNFAEFISSSKVRKGTYFIKVQGEWTNASRKRYIGKAYSLSWK